MDLRGRTVVVGVSGGIAAYWAVELIGTLRARGVDVRVVMTENAERFITPLTIQTVSGNEVLTDMFKGNSDGVSHITYARKADFIIIAPATANVIGKIANGIADDALSCIVMATTASVLICPSMNSDMWSNPIVQENVKKLRRHGYRFVGPERGEMACGGIGVGRLAGIEAIISRLAEIDDEQRQMSHASKDVMLHKESG